MAAAVGSWRSASRRCHRRPISRLRRGRRRRLRPAAAHAPTTSSGPRRARAVLQLRVPATAERRRCDLGRRPRRGSCTATARGVGAARARRRLAGERREVRRPRGPVQHRCRGASTGLDTSRRPATTCSRLDPCPDAPERSATNDHEPDGGSRAGPACRRRAGRGTAPDVDAHGRRAMTAERRSRPGELSPGRGRHSRDGGEDLVDEVRGHRVVVRVRRR